jgi:hypothetical protein
MVARRRIPLLAMGAVGLLCGLMAGEARLGWPLPDHVAGLAMLHGPLMICAFLGTVIGLERAVALQGRWGYAAPLLSGVGGLILAAGAPEWAGAALTTLASLVFLTMALLVVVRQPALFTAIMAVGALCWCIGNVLWLAGWPVADLVPVWACFLVLTIAGERVELSRFLRPAADRTPTAPVPVLVLLAGAAAAALGAPWAGHAVGGGLLLLALWLLRHDIARRTIRQHGLTRYMAACLLTGYAWLATAGALALGGGLPSAGPVYDAILHAVFVGFVFAMIFGHAPVILPAVLRVTVPFHAGLAYALLAALHGSVALRLVGDLGGVEEVRRFGGLLNAVVILGFILVMAARTVAATRARGRDLQLQTTIG